MSERATPHQILATLAALAPDSPPVVNQHVPRGDRVAIPLSYTRMFEHGSGHSVDPSKGELSGLDKSSVDGLLKRARIHSDERLLRIGWLWINAVDATGSNLVTPLVSMPVRQEWFQPFNDIIRRVVLSKPGYTDIVPLGEAELTDLIADPVARSQLDQTIAYGGGALAHERGSTITPALLGRLPKLDDWARRACAATGLRPNRVAHELENLTSRPGTEKCHVVAQVMLYIAAPTVRSVTIATTLRSWTGEPLGETGLAAIYGCSSHGPDAAESSAAIRSSIVLTPTQRDAIARSQTEPITVISGAPGSGKTQTVAAIALDAVARAETVLVAAPSDAAVEALIELLQRVPGPDPLVFGSSQRRLAVADRLGQGGGTLLGDDAVDAARRAFDQATGDADTLLDGIESLLTAEQMASDADPAIVAHARRVAPRWFDTNAALDEAERLADRATTVGGVFRGFRRRRRLAALVTHAGARAGASTDQLGDALRTARARQQSIELEGSGGLDLSGTWPPLVAAEERLRIRHGEWLEAFTRSRQRVDDDSRSTMAFVAAALRAGRAVRRAKLAEIDGRRLTRALPLWIGTLRDIDDLLPTTPAMFDLVIVDEASQVDQIAAAPALLRGHRAVVVGDPKQLRHVSFISDAAIDAAQVANRIVDAADRARLDVRRLSLFDLAASAAPTTMLDEHFRSAPHLIGFPMRRFYDGEVAVATTHPRNHDLDCISIEHVDGTRDDKGVNAEEVERAIEIARELLARSRSGGETVRLGIVTPFRDQADAIEKRAIDTFTLEDIDALDLRVGTVHGFQGCERDVVVISTAIDDETPPGARSFLADPNLFNVMVTRARDEIIVLTSVTSADGLLGDYLRWGEAGPSAPVTASGRDRPVDELVRELAAAGVPARAGYPAGRHRLDLVVGDGERAFGVTYGVHPEGPAAHIERHLSLARAGWDVREFFDSRWGDRPAELAVELVLEAKRRLANST